MKKLKRPKNRAFFFAYIWLKQEKSSKHFYIKNNAFAKEYGILKKDIIYMSRHSATIIAKITREQAKKISRDPRCVGITPYRDCAPRKMSEKLLYQLNAPEPLSQATAQPGVFGMISVEREIFSTIAPQLTRAAASGQITVLEFPVTPIPSLHPSVVLSEIIGEKITVDGEVYRGIAEGARCVFSTSETAVDVLAAIEKLIDLNIRVINFSAGILNPEEYSDFDRQIDRLIESTGILFVTAAGNRRLVASPGIAFNALTVGNLQTKSSPDAYLPPPWSTRCINEVNCSAFLSSAEVTHKPEVAAPGTYIPFITPSLEVYAENTGTSFACPWITGIAVKLLEIRESLASLELKAIIALTCNRAVISNMFNGPVEGEPFMLERTGFGLPDMEKAADCAKNAQIEAFTTTTASSLEFELEKGAKIGIAVCFNKNVERSDERVNMSLSTSGGEIICDRPNQNLHVIEYISSEKERVTARFFGTAGIMCARVIYIENQES